MSEQQSSNTEEVITKELVLETPLDDDSATVTEEQLNDLIIDDSLPDSALTKEEHVDTTEQEEEESITSTTIRKKQNVFQEYSITADVNLSTGDELVLPSNFDAETRDVLERAPNVNLLDNPEARAWATDLAEGLELTSYNETFVPTLENQESEFRHKLEHNGGSLMSASPKFKNIENQNIKGERAVIRIISHLGLGTLFQVSLWHSGLWVTFKPPSEAEIIELNRLLVSDKIKLGRYTYGLVFSNVSSYTTDRLMDFALAHIYDITSKVEDITIDTLKDNISCQDIPSFLWGFICTMYPRGFKYRRACVNDPVKCNHVIEETLNLTKLQWTNTKALTDWQKTFMAGRQSKMKDKASIVRYKEELTQLQNKKIVINEGMSNEVIIIIKTPSVTEHVDAGHKWINDIVDVIDKTVGTDINEQERNGFIVKHAQASAMRQYSHWVDSIEYDTNVIDDRETIEQTLDVLSADDEVRIAFNTGVVDYINSSTVSVIGIPVFDCPVCNKTQEASIELPAYKNIIPLDVMQLFFQCLTQRMSRLMAR
jgi:uncharacterized protein